MNCPTATAEECPAALALARADHSRPPFIYNGGLGGREAPSCYARAERPRARAFVATYPRTRRSAEPCRGIVPRNRATGPCRRIRVNFHETRNVQKQTSAAAPHTLYPWLCVPPACIYTWQLTPGRFVTVFWHRCGQEIRLRPTESFYLTYSASWLGDSGPGRRAETAFHLVRRGRMQSCNASERGRCGVPAHLAARPRTAVLPRASVDRGGRFAQVVLATTQPCNSSSILRRSSAS